MIIDGLVTIKKWNQKTDAIENQWTPLLPNDHRVVSACMPWAYAINTATGFFRLFIKQKFKFPDMLIFNNGGEDIVLCDNVVVYPQKFCQEFMLFKDCVSRKMFLVDSRGILFDITDLFEELPEEYSLKIEKDKRAGCYRLGTGQIKYRKPEEQELFEENIRADKDAIFNKNFNRFVRRNAKNETKYLYLTGGPSKCGAIVEHFVSKGMECERVPNLLTDDDTVNVRIPLTSESLKRKDVQYLIKKYKNSYAIYNIPYHEVGGGLELSWKVKNKLYGHQLYMPESKQAAIYYIINTFRSMFDTDDDYEVFKKTISKVIKMIDRGKLANPNRAIVDKAFLSSRVEGYAVSAELRSDLKEYEDSVLQEMAAEGKKITKWTNENTLFSMVLKEYSDTIYQYRSEWLGKQSIDVYIPSLKVGIEYQGKQHYEPIDFFGGEEAFEKLKQRDAKKKALCESNGVTLIEWKYDEPISKKRLQDKLKTVTVKNEGR